VGGIPIKDWTDYADAQIPGGSYVAGVTGQSPTSLFTQNRRMVEEGKYEGLANGEGNWSGDSITSLLNYVFGLSIGGMSHQNQKNFAEIETRNAG
jgi:hypothetical protein